jgi:hypothetical protein
MHSTLAAALLALAMTPTFAFAQTSPNPSPSAPAAASGPGTTSPAKPAATGITREQYVERAKQHAGQRAGARFDQLDANHDGILDTAEMRAWHREHPRRAKAPAASTSSQ